MTPRLQNRNSLMVPPDADGPVAPPTATDGDLDADGLPLGEPKGIRYHATRLNHVEEAKRPPGAPSPSRSRIHAAISGTPCSSSAPFSALPLCDSKSETHRPSQRRLVDPQSRRLLLRRRPPDPTRLSDRPQGPPRAHDLGFHRRHARRAPLCRLERPLVPLRRRRSVPHLRHLAPRSPRAQDGQQGQAQSRGSRSRPCECALVRPASCRPRFDFDPRGDDAPRRRPQSRREDLA